MNNSNEKLTKGNIYDFVGYKWIAAEVKDGHTVLQSIGVTAGLWPGFTMPQFGNGDWYDKNIDGLDISAYDAKMSELYERINDAEFADAEYGKGLFLVSNEKAGTVARETNGSGNYWKALRTAAKNHSSYGIYECNAWLGTVNGDCAWYVYEYGNVTDGYGQSYPLVVAPTFNLNTSKIEVDGNEIVIL